MKKVGKRIKRILPAPELVGSREAYRVQYENETIFFVSEAVYELLHDDDVKHDVMRQIKIVDLEKLIGTELNNLIFNDYDF